METSALLGLIDACVSDLGGEGLRDLVIELRQELPRLLRSPDPQAFDQISECAHLIRLCPDPQPVSDCVHVLLDVAAAHMPKGKSAAAIILIERAMDLAEDHKLKAEMRRAYNHYSLFSTDVGNPSRGLEFASKAADLAGELGDLPSLAAAWGNATAALFTMGLYRETISCALRVIRQFGPDARCAAFVAAARTNLASAALALQNFALCVGTARQACEAMGLPRDAHGILNRVIAEGTWLRGAIGLRDDEQVSQRIEMIRGLSDAFDSPRLKLHRAMAEAALSLHQDRLPVAVSQLLELLKHTKQIPGLYRNNLALLVAAYEKGGDHGGALIYLGELVEFLREKQVSAVKANLDVIHERYQTRLPGKDDVREVIRAIQRSKPGDAVVSPSDSARAAVPEQDYRDAFERLAVSAEMKEDVGGRHAYRMGRLAGLLARKLGYDRKFCDEVEKGARLHDIGKLGIPDGLLLKAGELTPAEWAVMKRHTLIGAQIIRQCPHPAFRVGEQIALCHHEKWDGSGYPKGLRGDNIPVPARIVMLADVYDALTHARPYKHAWTHDEVVAYITERAGSQFDPNFAQLFVAMVNDLRRDHGDGLDDYLAEPSKQSSFIQARDRMQEMLSEMAPLQPGEFL